MRTLIVEPILTDAETLELKGKFINDSFYHTVVDYDCDAYYHDESGNKKLLFHFRKNFVPESQMKIAMNTFKKAASRASNKRTIASGYSKIVGGKGGETLTKVKSLIAGYFDKPRIRDKRNVIKNGLVPCRTTAFTKNNQKEWKQVKPLIHLLNRTYKDLQPEVHRNQHELASMTPEFQIDGTAFSTITANWNWRTACHVDKGDYHNGYTVILVAEDKPGTYKGGFLGYPKFGVCVDVRNGDFILKDPHQYHANTEITPLTKNWSRLSLVFYYRENMQKCSTEIRHIDLPKRGLDLQLTIRPNTTDEKVIDEVFKRNSYDKPKVNFRVCDGKESWLDLGGNIGTFSLIVLSRGGRVVTCEPEPSNLKLLETNLSVNFPKTDGRWIILPVAVSSQPSGKMLDLYICKGDYNKYRHTLKPVRGRKTLRVKNMNIHDLLSEYSFDCIKMDIEGAEIDILETLVHTDYRKYGIHKLVLEYSFDVDRSIPRFLGIINELKKHFSTVFYTKVNPDELEYNYYPPACMVYCKV